MGMPAADAVHLIGGDDKRCLEAFENGEGLQGLGLEAFVYIHYQDSQISQRAATAAHGGEGMMSRRVDK